MTAIKAAGGTNQYDIVAGIKNETIIPSTAAMKICTRLRNKQAKTNSKRAAQSIESTITPMGREPYAITLQIITGIAAIKKSSEINGSLSLFLK
jgi:hypothetical protein